MYNVNRDPKKHPKPVSPFDFFPESTPQHKPAQSAQELLNVFQLVNAVCKQKRKRK